MGISLPEYGKKKKCAEIARNCGKRESVISNIVKKENQIILALFLYL